MTGPSITNTQARSVHRPIIQIQDVPVRHALSMRPHSSRVRGRIAGARGGHNWGLRNTVLISCAESNIQHQNFDPSGNRDTVAILKPRRTE